MNELKQISKSVALKHLMDLLKVEGSSGREGKVAKVITQKLKKAGCKASWIRYDQANKRMREDYEIGNLIVKLPGTIKAPRRMLMGHMDTVPLCKGAVPVLKGNRITPKGKTALGADNRTAVACIVTVIETILKNKTPHPPLTLLFTVGEEVGLNGAKHVKVSELGKPAFGINIDSGKPANIITGAIGAERWQVDVHGRSSHAGMHPEDGISATVIASRAIADVAASGYFGKVVKGKNRGTSNVGSIGGGEATNQVTDHIVIRGESRSHNAAFVKHITKAYRDAFTRAAKKTKNAKGQSGSITFRAETDYTAFTISEKSDAVQFAFSVGKTLGFKPKAITVNGGLDANFMNRKGVPTITIGAGQHGAHTVDEYVDVKEYLQGCGYALALATRE